MNELIHKLVTWGIPEQIPSFLFIIVLLWIGMIVAVAVDMWSGTDSARTRGEKIISGGLRRTFSKIGDYWRVQIMVCVADMICSLLPWFNLPYFSILITLGAIGIEIRSVWENARAKKSHITKLPLVLRDIMKIANAKDPLELLNKINAIIPNINNDSHEEY